jgi:hypothetical protein
MPEPSRDEKLTALEAAASAAMVRADALLTRKEDDDARLAKLVADAVTAALKAHHDDRRRDRHEDDDAEPTPPEQEKETERQRLHEPEPMSSDDDRLRREDDRHDRHHREDDRRDRRADAARRAQDDENDRLQAQHDFDAAFLGTTGERAPQPIVGQSARTYKIYCLNRLKKYSDDYAKMDLSKLPPDALDLADRRIRADAIAVGSSPQELSRFMPSGNLQREIRRQDRTGRVISEFVGPVDAPNGMFKPFELPPQRARFDMDLIREARRRRD